MSEKIPTGKTGTSEGAQTTSEADALAKIASLVSGKEVTPTDLEQRQTEEASRRKEELLHKVRWIFRESSESSDKYYYQSDQQIRFFKNLPPEIWEDEDFLIRAVSGYEHDPFVPHFLKNISEELKDNRDFFLKIAEVPCLELASDRLRGDKEIVMAAVKNHPRALRFASDALKADKEIALEAARGGVIEYASEELRGDRELALLAVAKDGGAFESLSEELRGDKEIALLAVANYSYVFKSLSDELRGDKEVAMKAIGRDGSMMKYVSEELRGDKEVALRAASSGEFNFDFLSKELQADHDIGLAYVRAARKNNTSLWSYYVRRIPKILFQDKSFAVKAVDVEPEILVYFSSEIKADKELVLRYLSSGIGDGFTTEGCLTNDFPDSIREDREFILDCLKKGMRFNRFERISDKLRGDISFILDVVQINPEAIKLASDEIKKKIGGA